MNTAILTGSSDDTNVKITKDANGNVTEASMDVTLRQAKDGWEDTSIKNIGGVDIANITATVGKKITVKTTAAGVTTFTTST